MKISDEIFLKLSDIKSRLAKIEKELASSTTVGTFSCKIMVKWYSFLNM